MSAMKPKTLSWLAWSIGIVAIALMLAALALAFADRHVVMPVSQTTTSGTWSFGNVLNDLVNIAATAFGILIAVRLPRNPIGWLFLTAGFVLGLDTFCTVYALHVLVADPGSPLAGRTAAWVSNSLGLIPLGVLCFLFLLFPTGRLPSPRWRPAAWYVVGVFTLATTAFMVFATISWSDPFGQPQDPSGGSRLFVLLPVGILSALVVSLLAVIARFRGAVGDERQQMKWFATGAACVVLALFPTFVSNAGIWLVLQNVAFVVLFSAIAVAVLKYRLYEIDVVINKTLVYGLVAAFFTVVYVLVVVGLGTAIGSTHNSFLTLAAAAVIAVAFNPVRQRAKRLADRLVYGRRATPYEVLSAFSERMGDTYALDDIVPRMARVLSEGTGGRAEIWIRVGDTLRSVAVWPAENGSSSPAGEREMVGGALPDFPGVAKAAPVIHQGELLGAITVAKPPGDPLRPAEATLTEDLASQAGLVLRNVRLNAELMARLDELRASRQRLVKAQDEAARRLERNIHDGAQQQLVALAVKIRLADAMVGRDDERAHAMLAQLQSDAGDALDDLRDLARGIYPPLLADQGLAVALEAQARKSPVPVTVEADGVGRWPQDIEAAVYFSCLEALQNIGKYAKARAASVHLSNGGGALTFEVVDDGAGFDPSSTGYGTGLQGIADRLDALGGSLEVRSAPGRGTTIVGRVPAPDRG
jgi:signal transduction histidine kinase